MIYFHVLRVKQHFPRKVTLSQFLQFLYCEYDLFAIDVPFFLITGERTCGHFLCKYFFSDLIPVFLKDLPDLIVCLIGHGDLIHNLESGFLTHGLDLADKFAFKAFL